MCEKDYFKETFKYFKGKPKELKDVINFELQNAFETVVPLNEIVERGTGDSCSLCIQLELVPHQEWRIYTLKNLDGFLFVKNPFTTKGQQHWIRKCLELYSRKPSKTNLDLHYVCLDDIWSMQKESDPVKCKLIDKLSWATMGYHHNWDTKIYDSAQYSSFPKCLAELAKHIASCLNFRTFKPEAAIVNYYNSKSSLGIHNDHSEEELREPIISISFGQTAIFLVGTELKTEKPIATFLRSGDIVILSGPSRLSYHAVPAIIKEPVCNRFCAMDGDESWKQFHDYIKTRRINLSIRQVYTDAAPE